MRQTRRGHWRRRIVRAVITRLRALARHLEPWAAPTWAVTTRGLLFRGRLLSSAVVAPPWESVLRADPCAYCGQSGGTVDHIVPLSQRGRNQPANMTGACRACNGRKGPLSLLEFLMIRPVRPVRRSAQRRLVATIGERLRHA